MAKRIKTKKEFNLTGFLSNNPDDLGRGEVFLRFDFWKPVRRVLQPWLDNEVKLEFGLHAFRLMKSRAQLGYYFGVMIPMIRAFMKERGDGVFTTDEIHLYNMYKGLGVEPTIRNIGGIEVITTNRKHVRDMTTLEFNEMVEALQLFWSEQGLELPDPKKGTNNNLTDFIEDD